MSVLLLNASYEPLTIISYRRAVALLLRERVDAASDEAKIMHSAGQALPIPAVLRLRRYVNVPRQRAALVAYGRAAPRWLSLHLLRQPGGRGTPGPHADQDRFQRRSYYAAQPRRQEHLGQHRLRLFELQPAQGRPHPARGRHDDAVGTEDPAASITLCCLGMCPRPGSCTCGRGSDDLGDCHWRPAVARSDSHLAFHRNS